MYHTGNTLILDKYYSTLSSSLSLNTLPSSFEFTISTFVLIRMVRIIKQGEYTSTIYKLIADGDFKEASQILESGKRASNINP